MCFLIDFGNSWNVYSDYYTIDYEGFNFFTIDLNFSPNLYDINIEYYEVNYTLNNCVLYFPIRNLEDVCHINYVNSKVHVNYGLYPLYQT